MMQAVEAGKVPISPVEKVDGAGFDGEVVEQSDLVRFALGYVDQSRDAAP